MRDLSRNLNSIARPFDEWAFSPLNFTAIWLSHLALAIYMFVVVNFDSVTQASDIRIERRQVVFLCLMQDSNLEVSRHLFAIRLNAHSQTNWAIEDKAKNSTALPYDEWAFSPLDSTAIWLSHLALAINMVVVVNCGTLTQVSNIPIHRRQVVFLCWMRDWNLETLRHLFARRLNARSQTARAIEDQTKQLSSTARPYDDWAFSPLDFTAVWLSHLALAMYMFVVVVNFDLLAQTRDIRIERRQFVFLCLMQDSNLEVSRQLFASRLNGHSQYDWTIEDQAKNWNSAARPYDEWAFSPLDCRAIWISHLALAIYMFAFVNLDALTQASDIRI